MGAKLEETIRDLVIANRILAREGVLDAFGHVSVRHPDDPERYIMARSRGPEQVTRDDLIDFTLESAPINQNGRPMYGERHIHGCLYQLRPEVNAVVHNHAHALIPFGITGTPLRPVWHMGAVIGNEVPIWDIYAEFGDTDMLVTSHAKGMSLARCLGPRPVALMRGHGSVVARHSLRAAVFTAVYLHDNAKMYLEAKMLGGEMRFLTNGETKMVSDMLMDEFVPIDRAWGYWAARAGFPGL